MDVLIRFAKKEDSEAISNIYALSWKVAYKGIVPEKYLFELSSNAWTSKFQDWIENKKMKVQIIYADNIVVGAIAYGKSRNEKYSSYGEIYSFYLHPDYYRKGLGTRLIDSAVKDMIKSEYKHCFLWVLEENENARKFYESKKFKWSKDVCYFEIMGKNLTETRYILDLQNL